MNINNSKSISTNMFVKGLKPYWKYRTLFILAVPGFALLILFNYVPMYGITLAFKDFKIMRGIIGSPWVGFENFRSLFSLAMFWRAAINTIYISLLSILFGFPAPIIFALLLNEIRVSSLKRTIQTISYLPHFLSWVVVAGLMFDLLSPTRGTVNHILGYFNVKPIMFLGESAYFRPILIVSGIWKGVGWGSIIYLASISNINLELYESSVIDGAGRLKQAIYITIPGLLPVITIFLILSAGSIFSSNFDQIFNLYNPMVYDVGDVLSTYIYRVGLQQLQFSLGTATGFLTNVINFLLIIGTNYFVRSFSEYTIW